MKERLMWEGIEQVGFFGLLSGSWERFYDVGSSSGRDRDLES